MDKLLFTGGTGFLGKNVRPVLEKMYEVTTCGITPDDMIKANFVTDVPGLPERYDIVLHAAGKAHSVPKTETEKQVFFDVNFQGTVNLCKALEKSGVPKAFVFISTVAVYGCEFGENITEDHPLNGDTPYAKSKIMAENYLTEWCEKNNVVLGILRPSLLAGKNAPGNLGSMVKEIQSGVYLSIANGKAHKSVLMVDDIARILPSIIEKGGIYNVSDSHHPTFGELEALISSQLGKRRPVSIPFCMAKYMAIVGNFLGSNAPINTLKLKKITESLTFSNEKARRELGWEPLDVLSNYKI
ncbi:MAG: NAD-dependent epimerase/dehydratase family protein [Fibrobacter sp.]|nr:NAD-dependent epimerase/dehydratase family protein [Fibrobacter sp.]